MNIIFNAAYQTYTVEVTKKLIEACQPRHYFVVTRETGWEKLYEELKPDELYYHAPCLVADYSGKLDENARIPLDNELLQAFAPYMSIAVKMCERIRDRVLTYEEKASIVMNDLEYWNTVLTRYEIGCYLSFDIPHEIYDFIIYALCKIKGIPCAFSCISFILGHSYMVSDIEDCCPEVQVEYEHLAKQYANTAIDDIPLEGEYKKFFEKQVSGKNLTPFYMKGIQNKTVKLTGAARVKNAAKLLFDTKGKVIHDYLYFRKKESDYRKSPEAAYFEKWNRYCPEVDLNQKFVYFPLHMQPECTTCPMGGWFVWQMVAIKMLSFALPEDVAIYVKENPKQTVVSRGPHYIDDLLAIPKVKLVAKSFDTYKLLDHCIAVASISGTALLEGLYKGKPGIMFGNFITKYSPGIFNVRTNAECKQAVDRILSTGAVHTHKDLKLFLLAMSKVCYLGYSQDNPLESQVNKEDVITSMAEAFEKRIDLLCRE